MTGELSGNRLRSGIWTIFTLFRRDHKHRVRFGSRTGWFFRGCKETVNCSEALQVSGCGSSGSSKVFRVCWRSGYRNSRSEGEEDLEFSFLAFFAVVRTADEGLLVWAITSKVNSSSWFGHASIEAVGSRGTAEGANVGFAWLLQQDGTERDIRGKSVPLFLLSRATICTVDTSSCWSWKRSDHFENCSFCLLTLRLCRA